MLSVWCNRDGVAGVFIQVVFVDDDDDVGCARAHESLAVATKRRLQTPPLLQAVPSTPACLWDVLSCYQILHSRIATAVAHSLGLPLL